MALTSTNLVNPVKTVIVNQTASTSASGVGDNNLAGGATYLVSISVNNAAFGTGVYTKLFNLSSATAGPDTATAVLFVPANVIKTYTFHPPLHFDVGLSMVTTTTAGQAGTTAPGTPPKVTLLLSSTAS